MRNPTRAWQQLLRITPLACNGGTRNLPMPASRAARLAKLAIPALKQLQASGVPLTYSNLYYIATAQSFVAPTPGNAAPKPLSKRNKLLLVA